MAQSITDGNFQKLVQWLDPKNKKTDLDNIDVRKALEEFLQKFVPNASIEENEEDGTTTFSYAGHVLHSSANVFAKKVDGLYNFVRSLMDDLTSQRERAEKKKAEGATVESQWDCDDFRDIMDDIKPGKHVELTSEDEAEREPIEYITDPPSCMVDFSKGASNRIPLFDYHGKLIGYQHDFALGSAWTDSSTGALSFSMNYNVPKEETMDGACGYLDGPIQEEPKENAVEDVGFDGLDYEADANDCGQKPLEDEAGDAAPEDQGDAAMKSIKKEQQRKLKERIEAALKPHNPYVEIELRDETKVEEKIHVSINNRKLRKRSQRPVNFTDFLNKPALGKGLRKPDDCLKDEADKEFLARRKNLTERAKENKELLLENDESGDDDNESFASEDEQRFDPVNINFDELEIHDEDDNEEFRGISYAQEEMAAKNAAAQEQLNTEENKKAFEAWEKHMKDTLEAEKDLPELDIGATMEEILRNIETKTESVPFPEVTPMSNTWDVSRVFLGTLILTNHGNLDIIDSEKDNLPANYTHEYLPVNKIKVKFIHSQRNEDHIRSHAEIEAQQRNREDTRRRRSRSGAWIREASPEPQPHCSKRTRP